MNLKATFNIIQLPRDENNYEMIIRDRNEGVTITNDAEAVVKELVHSYRPKRILYYDTDGNVDELVFSGDEFLYFQVFQKR